MTHSFRSGYRLLLLSALTVMLFSCTQGPPVPFPAIDFNLEDVFTGEEIDLANLRGRPVLLYFFASW
jgi:cytochrome oxidase Cu insertion factor (SCO1/SenC/PrrC family)